MARDYWLRHGHARRPATSPTYRCWRNMIARCEKPTSNAFDRYGAKGITVCAEWHKFDNFLRDMGEKPKGLTIDRIDGTRGYYKANCRWATIKEQNRNQSRNRTLTAFGKSMCMAAWAEEFSISDSCLLRRLQRGLSAEEALTRTYIYRPKPRIAALLAEGK